MKAKTNTYLSTSEIQHLITVFANALATQKPILISLSAFEKNTSPSLPKQHLNDSRSFDGFIGDMSIEFISDSLTVSAPLTSSLTAPEYFLSDLIDKYFAEVENAASTLRKKQSVLRCFKEFYGDMPVQSIGKLAHVRPFKEALMTMPKNVEKKFKNLPFAELAKIEAAPEDRMSKKTVNQYLLAMGHFMTWCIKAGYYKGENPFSGSYLSVNKLDRNARKPYSSEFLSKLFTSTIYTGCKGPGRRYEAGEHIIKDSYYWLPFLGRLTGARLGELCQLTTSDIKCEYGVWYMDINENDEDKKVKSSSGHRFVPIHSNLIQMGFLEMVQERVAEGESRIFPDVPLSKDSNSNVASKRYAYAIKSLGLKQPKNGFHSFRHNVEDDFMAAQVPDSIKHRIIGHNDGHISAVYGGDRQKELEVFANAINCIPSIF